MLISDDKKIIFFHIPKTGGTTIQKHLKNKIKNSVEFWGINWVNGDKSHIELKRAKEYVPKDKVEKYFKICFVRNPYDKIYSGFLELKKHKRIDSSLTFRDFVLHHMTKERINSYGWIYVMPMVRFILNENGKIGMDHIAKYECFEKEKDFIYQKYSVSDSGQFNFNVTNGDPTKNQYLRYIGKYDRIMLRQINFLYHKDFVLLNYPKLQLPISQKNPFI